MEDRVLFIFTRYNALKESPYLTNELVDEFCRRGSAATIISYDRNRRGIFTRQLQDRKEIYVGLSATIKYFKYMIAWPLIFFTVLKELMGDHKYNRVIMNAPLVTILPALLLLPFFKNARKQVIIWDLFPIHQVKAGAIPKYLEPFLKWLEVRLLHMFDGFGLMGDNNKREASHYYKIPEDSMLHTGVWGVGEKEALNTKYDGGLRAIRAVFGGQLVAGRRLDVFISFLLKLKEMEPNRDVYFDIYSSGSLYDKYRNQYANETWIRFLEPVDRKKYLQQLVKYNFGVIVTDEAVQLPTLPSKVVDYINASINVLAMVEDVCELRTDVYQSECIILIPFDYSASLTQINSEVEKVLNSTKDYEDEFRYMFSVKRTVGELLK